MRPCPVCWRGNSLRRLLVSCLIRRNVPKGEFAQAASNANTDDYGDIVATSCRDSSLDELLSNDSGTRRTTEQAFGATVVEHLRQSVSAQQKSIFDVQGWQDMKVPGLRSYSCYPRGATG